MEFPVYKLKINMDDDTGLTAVSLVDYPAVERDFLLFDKQCMLFKADDEKRIISGIALLADTPIYRRNQTGEYYVIFEKDTIRQLVEKYSKNGLLNSVNLMHQSDMFVNSVYMLESLIIDKNRNICPIEFADVPDGSWYVSYFVEDEQLWNEIKKGEWFRGFSVEVTAELELKMQSNLNKEDNTMNKLFKLAKMILKLAEIATDKGILIYDGELQVGTAVFVETENDPVPAENGEYTVEDGRVITVEDGIVAEIKEPETEETTVEEEMEDETVDTATEIEALNETIREQAERIAELEAILAERDSEIAELKSKNAEQEEKLKMSVAAPVTKKTNTKENKALKYFN